MRSLSTTRARRLAWSTSAICLGLNTAAVVLAVLSPDQGATPVLLPVVSQAFPMLGAIVASRRPEHRLGWIYLAAGLILALGNAFSAYALYALLVRAGELPGGLIAAWLAALLVPGTFWALAQLFLVHPDGHLPSRRWRIFAWAFGGVATVATMAVALTPGDLFGVEDVPNPFAINADFLVELSGAITEFISWGLGLGFVVSAVSMIPRFRRSARVERQQLKWVMYPAVVSVVLWAVYIIIQKPGAQATHTWVAVLATVSSGVVPVGGAISILRYRLFDIDLIIRRSIVYGVLWFFIGAAYVGVTGALGIAAGERVPLQVAIALTIAATLLFQPLRHRLDRLARRRIYGERLSGYELVRRFGETLEHAYDVAELAPRIATTVREGLGVRWARVSLRLAAGEESRTQPVGAAGIGLDEGAAPEVTTRMTHGGEDVGLIECGPKSDDGFTQKDHELLNALARQAALAIRNVRLAIELEARLDEIRRQADEIQASRARIVHAQDAERRRIERNLHDGIQQEIVSVKARLRLARNQLRRGAEEADATLEQLQTEVGQMLEEMRELAHGIHPPVLTARGLVEAVEARLAAIPIGVSVHADADARQSRFAEDIEEGAYFFISEALTNVLKHAEATSAAVRISTPGERLLVEVSDDGVGFVPGEVSGSGLTGLKDRIEALGGSFSVFSRPGEGTRLLADLPARRVVPTDV